MKESFEAALDGLKKGEMTYATDPLLPMLQIEIEKRTEHFKTLTPEDERKILSLNEG